MPDSPGKSQKRNESQDMSYWELMNEFLLLFVVQKQFHNMPVELPPPPGINNVLLRI